MDLFLVKSTHKKKRTQNQINESEDMAICFSKFSWFLKFGSFQVKSHIEEFPRKQDLFQQLFSLH